MIWINGARTVCGSHTPHTLMKAPNYGKSWRLKPLERTQQNAHGIKLKATVIDGAKWPRSWQRSLDGGVVAIGSTNLQQPARF